MRLLDLVDALSFWILSGLKIVLVVGVVSAIAISVIVFIRGVLEDAGWL